MFAFKPDELATNGYPRCAGLWEVRLDNDQTGHVIVFLWDLGRACLPTRRAIGVASASPSRRRRSKPTYGDFSIHHIVPDLFGGFVACPWCGGAEARPAFTVPNLVQRHSSRLDGDPIWPINPQNHFADVLAL